MEVKQMTLDQTTPLASRVNYNKKERVEESKKEQEESTQKEKNKQQEKSTLQEKKLFTALEKLSGKFELQDNELSFSIHEKTKQIMIKVVDKETKEVVREIPPEKILDIVASVMEVAGLIVDERR